MLHGGSWNGVRALCAPVAAAALAMAASTSASVACPSSQPGGPAVFPLQPNLGSRHLADAAGRPFFMHGDTAWSLIGDLTREDAELYLRDRHERGFNTVLVSLIEHFFSTNAPANAYGDAPFLAEGDFSKPNPAYFDHAEWVLQRACDLGFVVMLTPAYMGVNGGEEGWYADMVASGPVRLREYGRWVGERLGRFDNIVWVQGGDYDPPDKGLVRALVDGINDSDPNAVHTFHGAPETRPLEYWGNEPWLAINNVYTYGQVHGPALAEVEREGDRPFFLMESAYENEHEAGAFRVRMQAYQAILSGATGHIYGNNPIWHFDGPGLFTAPGAWQEELASPGAHSMTVLRDVFMSREWWRLRPDLDEALLRSGRGWRSSRAVAARADDGSFALVYLPSARRLALDLAQLSGGSVMAEWVDPSTGAVIAVAGSPFDARWQSLRAPRRNASGDSDWILVLTAAQGPPPASASEVTH